MNEQYVALVNVNGQTLWIANSSDNNPRMFDDKELAESTAKVFSDHYKIMTLDEFNKEIGR